MSGVLALVLAAALGVTYATLARSATSVAAERLRRASREIATVAETSIRLGRARYRDVAADSAVRRALRERAVRPTATDTAGADSEVLAALQRLVSPADSGMPVELWTAHGQRVAFVGTDLRAMVRQRAVEGDFVDSADARAIPVPHEGLDAVLGKTVRRDSLLLGALYASHGRVHYWVVAPVLEKGVPLGYLVQQRRIAAAGRINQTIRELAGDSVTAYYRNRDGGFWSTLAGDPATAPRRESTARGVALTRPDVGPVLTAEAGVTATPLVIVFELAQRRVLARPRAIVLTLAGVSLALLALGAVITWGISRRITRPIASLTAAAESLARGDYEARARASGDDEIARLATSFNHMAEEISAMRAALERESAEASAANVALARSNTELLTAREVAETASRAKSAFLATMSHELRTPLNAIGGYAELMELGIHGPVTDDQRRDLDRIRVSQQHLLGLVSAILDLSRIERGDVSYQLAPVAIDAVLAGLDALVGPQASASGLVMEYVPCTTGLAAMADGEKLRQILLNLLSNAIRYTPAGGSVVIGARALDDARIEISVRDTGVGIPDEKQAQIFEPFVQLDRSLTNVREGVGLGLAISRDLARGMGGDLAVASRIGRGSCFTLTLPRATVDAPVLAPAMAGD
ncbi:ATP-binding region ATPase domain protein [Gemmatirosa kalamazoonensis]|uniref:histidine kinase n=1 Tax=Gemmatirosa kalamazoonensis TaxID=861299 RepID=W0RIP4_9BACT|nr:ATP-binding protein [Gemmatirosa kalamazoonensis]AHG89268.1 ATP-binding region ATPase domain protein [Gemmatirosa kalamazoonensis]